MIRGFDPRYDWPLILIFLVLFVLILLYSAEPVR